MALYRRHRIEPQEYLTDVVLHLLDMKITEVRSLIPSNPKPTHSELVPFKMVVHVTDTENRRHLPIIELRPSSPVSAIEVRMAA